MFEAQGMVGCSILPNRNHRLLLGSPLPSDEMRKFRSKNKSAHRGE